MTSKVSRRLARAFRCLETIRRSPMEKEAATLPASRPRPECRSHLFPLGSATFPFWKVHANFLFARGTTSTTGVIVGWNGSVLAPAAP